MIKNGIFYVVTSDLLSISFFTSFKKEGVSLEIMPSIESVMNLLKLHNDLQSVMVLVDISTDELIFEELLTFTTLFPSKQIICFAESVELEQIRKTKELSIPSVVTKNDFQKLFALLITQ